MNHFRYREGRLYAEELPLTEIAAEVGTPFYCYSTATLVRHYEVLADALAGLDARICFAVKANASLAVLRTLALKGAGADVVSEGELRLALKAGILADRIVFSGVGKTDDELAFALETGIHQINAESAPEIDRLSAIASRMGRTAPVAIRVNPDVDAHTHAKISTGAAIHKFGIPIPQVSDLAGRIAGLPGLRFAGLAQHIGSQLTELDPFAASFAKLRALVLDLRGRGIAVPRLDLGGGLGIPYARDEVPPPPAAYGEVIRTHLGDLGCAITLEPGRMLVGNAGVLVARVVCVKTVPGRTFVIVDAGMNDLVRPAMYGALHDILPLAEPAPEAPLSPVDVAGPICETGDTFARRIPLPPLAEGDLIAFASAGAYGASMSSTYNGRRLVPEVLVNGNRSCVTRRRPDWDEMTRLETLPNWL